MASQLPSLNASEDNEEKLEASRNLTGTESQSPLEAVEKTSFSTDRPAKFGRPSRLKIRPPQPVEIQLDGRFRRAASASVARPNIPSAIEVGSGTAWFGP